MYRKFNWSEVRKKQWAILQDYVHNYKHLMNIYHINPKFQIKQLNDTGFIVATVYDKQGNEVVELDNIDSSYFYYLCKKS